MEILLASILAFISTNVDDIFILILFYGNKRFKGSQIIAGQLLGIAALIAFSMAASLLGLFIPSAYIGLLGFIPMYIGAKELYELLKEKHQEEEAITIPEEMANQKGNTMTVAGVTIANGGDNVAIYIPLFATLTLPDKLTMALIFLVLTVVLCVVARYVTRHPFVGRVIEKYGHIVTPVILILLGVFILYENESVGLVTKLFRN
jgi:cadmium resistance protein CadD (predicted permease)